MEVGKIDSEDREEILYLLRSLRNWYNTYGNMNTFGYEGPDIIYDSLRIAAECVRADNESVKPELDADADGYTMALYMLDGLKILIGRISCFDTFVLIERYKLALSFAITCIRKVRDDLQNNACSN